MTTALRKQRETVKAKNGSSKSAATILDLKKEATVQVQVDQVKVLPLPDLKKEAIV
jgi:hypothetical protein